LKQVELQGEERERWTDLLFDVCRRGDVTTWLTTSS
jgi:hypothetical protein